MGTFLLTVIAGVCNFVMAFLAILVTVNRPQPEKWSRYQAGFLLCGITGLFATAIVAALTWFDKVQPDYDYAYLSQIASSEDQVAFLVLATHNLDFLKVARNITKTMEYVPGTRKDFGYIRQGKQADNVYTVPIGDWTLDVDSPGEYGSVWQHLIISNPSGMAAVVFSRVTRKSNKQILCQTPRVWVTRRSPTCN